MKSYTENITVGSPLKLPISGQRFLIKSSSAGSILSVDLFKGNNKLVEIAGVGKRFKASPMGGFDMLVIRTSADSVVQFIVLDGDIEIDFDDDGQYINNTNAQAVPVRTVPGEPLEVLFAGTVEPVLGVVTVDNTDLEAIPIKNQALTTLSHAAPVSVGIVATALISDATLKKLRIRNAHATAVVGIGGAGVTLANAAIQLQPGDVWLEDDAAGAAWFAISDTAATNVQVMGVK